MTARRDVGKTTSLRVLTPLIERWRALAALFLATAVGVAAVRMLLVPPRYEAKVLLATVGSSKLPGNLGGLAGLAGLAGQNLDLTANPDLVSALLESRRVLLEVAAQPLARDESADARSAIMGAHTTPIIVAVTGDPAAAVAPLVRIERQMRNLVTVSSDKRTGLITLAVAHRDSAVARAVANGLVHGASRSFADLSRAQARAQRLGLEARVDSMQSLLRRAEARSSAFLSANRVVPEFSPLAVEQQQLAREVSVAQQAYVQAVTERESAVARELQDTPAVVAVDPVPARLDPLPKFALFFGLAAAVAVTFVAVSMIYLAESFRRLRGAETEDPDVARLLRATRRIPVVRRLAGRADAPVG